MNQQEYIQRFKEIVKELADLTARKNSDYADASDAFHNFKQIEQLTKGRISAADGILVRMTDKLTRLAGLISGRDAKVKEESIRDTVKDMAVYSIILYILLGEESKKQEISYPSDRYVTDDRVANPLTYGARHEP